MRQPKPSIPTDRLRSTRRERWVDALACLSVSTLYFSRARGETLFLADSGFYNRVPLGAPVLVALLLNIVGLAAVGFLGIQAIRRVRRPAWRRLAAVAAAATLLIALNFTRITHESSDGRTRSAVPGCWLSQS